MIEIKVFNGEKQSGTLSLAPDAMLTLEEASPYFDEHLDQGTTTYPFDVPFDAPNRNALGSPEVLEGGAPPSWLANAYDAGAPFIQRGKLTLLEHAGNFDYTRGSYTLSMAGPESYFGKLIAGKKLAALSLGGTINTGSYDMRQFAAQVMLGNMPQYPYLSFAPIYWPDFIDTSREDYDNEQIATDFVNNVIANPAFGGTGWTFGRPTVANPLQPVSSGNPGYEDYRTVPFFNLAYVLKQCFAEHGYTLFGDLLNDPDFNKVFVFNNRATNIYNTIHQDISRRIYPGDHMPDMLIADFLEAIRTWYGQAYVFLPGNKVLLKPNDAPMRARDTINLSERTLSTYKATRTEISQGGVTIQFAWDNADGMVGERIQEVDLNMLRATGDTLANATVAVASPKEGDLVFVINENSYYRCDAAGAWIFYSERQQPRVIGDGRKTIECKASPLCQLVSYDTVSGTIHDTCCVRMPGSYINNKKKLVSSPFALRLFYIDKFNGSLSGVTGMPVSFTHSLDAVGVRRVKTGLSFATDDGLYPRYLQRWVEAQLNGWSVKANFLMRADEVAELLPFDKKVQIGGVQYMVQKRKSTIGAQLRQVEADLLVV